MHGMPPYLYIICINLNRLLSGTRTSNSIRGKGVVFRPYHHELQQNFRTSMPFLLRLDAFTLLAFLLVIPRQPQRSKN